MSKVELNSITINKSIPDDPFFYIGALINSRSGYLTPKLITSIEELELFYGKFKYDAMYKDLIKFGIASCLLPILTRESKYNVCSLRLNNSDINYCYPKKDKHYNYSIKDKSCSNLVDLINEGNYTYGILLDFTDVTLDTLNTGTIENSDDLNAHYIIINTGKVLDNDTNDTMDQIVCTGTNLAVSSSDYNRPKDLIDPFIIFNKDVDLKDILGNPTKVNYLKNFKDVWNNPIHTRYTDSICKDLTDLIFDYITNFLNKVGLPQSANYPSGLPYNEWKKKFVEDSFAEDFWITNNEEVSDILESIIQPLTVDLVNSNILINRLNNLELPNDKQVILFNNPSVDLNHFDFPGLKYSMLYNYSQDKLSSYTERDKVVEFYSKIKGDVGKDIVITIDDVMYIDNVYDITITNDLITETYRVKLFDIDNSNSDIIHITEIANLSKLVEVKIYNYWFGERLSGELTDQYLIDDRYFDPYNKFKLDYYSENKRDISELKLPTGTFKLNRITEEVVRYRDIVSSLESYKTSDWYPDLFIVTEVSNDCVRNEVGDLKSNLLDEILNLVDFNYVNDSITSISDIADQSIFSQALVNLTADQLNPEWFRMSNNGKHQKLLSDNNRIMYFFGKLIINDIEYPALYPYIINFIEQKYLEYPAVNVYYDPYKIDVGGNLLLYKMNSTKLIDVVEIIESTDIDYGKLLKVTTQHMGRDRLTYYGLYDSSTSTFIEVDSESLTPIDTDHKYHVEPIMQYIDSRQINHMMYDNLVYYWESIHEPLDQQSIFLLRFISSKYTRECYKIRHEITGLSDSKIRSRLEEVNTNCLVNLDYVDTSKLEIYYNREDPNLLKATFSITVPKITNKVFKLDIILNV